MYCGGRLSVSDGSLLSASANVFLSAGMCFTLKLYVVMLSSSLNSLLFVTLARSLFSLKLLTCVCAPFMLKWFSCSAHVSAFSSSSKIEWFFGLWL